MFLIQKVTVRQLSAIAKRHESVAAVTSKNVAQRSAVGDCGEMDWLNTLAVFEILQECLAREGKAELASKTDFLKNLLLKFDWQGHEFASTMEVSR